ncbi:MAG: bifunctional riboflavin kinase/FAD synthetase [Bacteroidales bacterium]|nr:bifunctional riboflavin kinase/FAD synthetase [Bacteroidales bacterium]
MNIYRDNDLYPNHCSVVTIGTFDGLHLGHRQLLEKCKQVALNNACTWMVYTFEPHPREVLGNDNFKLITTSKEKLFLFEKLGVQNIYIKKFTKDFSQKSAKDFVEEELLGKLNLKHLVIGYDHQFGKDRQGTYEVLNSLSIQYGFSLHRIEPVYFGELTISSTKIRNALENGNIDHAATMLGYPFILTGVVRKGLHIGRTLGFPTANLFIESARKLIPKTGVYAVWVLIENFLYRGVMNIGYRPTLNIPEHPLSIEVHVLDFDGDLYDKEIKVFVLHRIRDDEKFSSLEELKQWIAQDVEITKQLFAENKEWYEMITFLL